MPPFVFQINAVSTNVYKSMQKEKNKVHLSCPKEFTFLILLRLIWHFEMFIPGTVMGCFGEGNLVIKAYCRESISGLRNINYVLGNERTPVTHALCFSQAQLQMLWDSRTFGWPSSWPLLCACCLSLPYVSCPWPFGHQKVTRFRSIASG